MKQKEWQLWEVYCEEKLVIIDPDDLIKKVSFYETEAYLFPSDTDMDVIRKALVEYRERKGKESISFGEILDEYSIPYRVANEAEPYDPNVVLCFPDNNDLLWAVCRMSNLVIGVSDVYRYWDCSDWVEIWSELHVGKRTKIIIDEDTKECLDRWNGSSWCYLNPFNHGYIYRILSVDGEPVHDKWLLRETTNWVGMLDWGEIIDEKDLDRIRNWAEGNKGGDKNGKICYEY